MEAPLQPRPRVGLVLGGGGAKGAAHVGVLGVLDELRIPVDCIIGTSMGALVGGTYASGMSARRTRDRDPVDLLAGHHRPPRIAQAGADAPQARRRHLQQQPGVRRA